MKNNIKLPLFETVFRSFTCILKNFKPFLKICSFFIVLWLIELATNLPSLCSADEAYCRTDSVGSFMTFLHYLAATIISVSIIRFIILKETTSWFHFHFGKNNIKFIAYNILIALMIIIPSALMIMIGGMSQHNNSSIFMTKFFVSLGIATFIGLCIYCFRLCLVYAGAAINDKSMTLSKSHTLTSGNMLKIFIGQVLLVIPTIILVAIVYNVYSLSDWGYTGKSIFVLIGMLISFFDSAVKASYYSHMYQYFIYFSNKQQNIAKVIQATVSAEKEKAAVTTKAPEPTKKVAAPKKSAPAKKAAPKKTTAKKAAPKAAAPKKTTTKTAAKPAAKKAPAKKVAAPKAPAKKVATSKAPAKKAVVKPVAKKAPAKKAVAKPVAKKAPAKKAPAKKAPAKKAVKK